MVVRKMAVDVGKQQVMLAGQARGELSDDGARGAVARVPADAEGAGGEALDQPVARGVAAVAALSRAFAPRIAGLPFPRRGPLAHRLNVGAEQGTPLKHHLETLKVEGGVDGR